MLRAAWRLIYRTVAVIAIVLLVELLGGCSSAPRKAPSFVAIHSDLRSIKSAADSARTSIAKAKSLAPRNTPEQDAALTQAAQSVDFIASHALTADTRLATVEQQTDSLADQLNACLPAVGKYHKVKFILCCLAAAAAGLLVFQFRRLLAFAGPYGLVAFAAVPAAAFAFVWFRL